jgi:DNA-binding NarL/FixJ family response regulator
MQANKKITVLTVDDHPMIREGIAGAVNLESDMTLVGEATNGQEAIEAFRRLQPDVALMDLQMPVMSGTEALTVIRSEFPSARIIMLTTYDGDVQAVRALRAGAQGYLLKSMLRKELLETIRMVYAGKRCIPREVAERIADNFDHDSLTSREIAVLRLVSNGHSNKLVGQQLSISEDTVKNHMGSILSKLSAQDRTHAVTIAMRRGFLDG